MSSTVLPSFFVPWCLHATSLHPKLVPKDLNTKSVHFLFSLAFLFFLLSCNTNQNEVGLENAVLQARIDSIELQRAGTVARMDLRMDSIRQRLQLLDRQRDSIDFTWKEEFKGLQIPVLKDSPVRIMSEKFNHDEELPTDMESRKWFGLYRHGKEYELREERPDVSAEYAVRKSKEALFHVAGIPGLASGPIKTAALAFKPIFPGESEHCEINHVSYFITATGEVDFDKTWGQAPRMKNYILHYSAHAPQKEWSSSILALSHFIDESPFRIVWAGFLDGDDKLDLVIDASFHYNTTMNLELFLSSFAEPNEWLKKVAVFRSVGC